MSEPKSTLQILIDARKLIENQRDWGPRNPTAKNCAQTAIDQSNMSDASTRDAERAFASAIGITSERVYASDIWQWNDAPKRTHPEVLAAFDRAIESERAKVTQ